MALFPQTFLDDLHLNADIVQVIGDVVSLKRSGATWKGLCPFHGEKTPSFHVNREKGFFHCFGCHVGGDVIKFVELHEKVSFPEAVRMLAGRFGLTVPEAPDTQSSGTTAAEREALLKVHEVAAAWFRAQLESNTGARVRQQLAARNISAQTIAELGIGFAPPAREALKAHLVERGFAMPLLLRSGLIVQRDSGPSTGSGEIVDRFRNRLMIPICRDAGSVIAFGGRATDADQQPKYLNSPETPIYSKSRTLYGLNFAKAAIRKLNYAVLVEGYFDVAQLVQAGISPVVASCGTALTPQQAQLLRRFTSKVVISFDPDAAGQGAAVRSCELLVSEGFDVNVALLPAGADPDTFVQREGREAYQDRLRASVPYLQFLLDRAATVHDLGTEDGRRTFLHEMLVVAARIPDAAARDQFADRLAHKARITEEVVRTEIRKAAGARKTSVPDRLMAPAGPLKPAERGLLWGLVHDPAAVRPMLEELEDEDLEQLAVAEVVETARELQNVGDLAFPSALLERLNDRLSRQVASAAAETAAPAPSAECVRALKLLRYDRERAALQREIDQLRDDGSAETATRIEQLYDRKVDLKRRIEALSAE
jgi:DNA primase